MVVDTLPFNWRNHEKDILNTFREWFVDGNLVDVTLACDGAILQVHKMVLSACSKYFRTLFEKNRCKHPVVIVGNVSYRDMKTILDFMYNGTISVPKENLSDFLKTAKLLQIKGIEEMSAADFGDSGNMTQNNDRQSTPHERLVTNIVRHPIPRSNSWVNLANECSQEEISIHDNDESEFMEAVVVKEEPEDGYNEIESQDDKVTRSIALNQSPVGSFVRGDLNAEQQKPQSSKTSDHQTCSTGAPLEVIWLPESISSGQGNQGPTMHTSPCTSGKQLRHTESFSSSNANISSRKTVNVEIQASSSSLNSASEKVSDTTTVVESQENSSLCTSSVRVSFQRNSDFPEKSCRSLNFDYDCKCTQKCASRIPPSVRSNVSKKFWSFNSYSQQNSFIRNTVFEEDLEAGRIVYRSKKRRRTFKRIYKLGGIVVCYQMYAKTLRINTDRINEALYSTRFLGNRIRHRSLLNGVGRCKLSEEKEREVIDYLEKSSNQTSHHSLHGLYTRYRQNTVSPVGYYHFAKIFKNNFTSCRRRNDKIINSDLELHKDKAAAQALPNQTTNLNEVVGQSGSNKTMNQQHAAVCHKHPPVNRENSHSSLTTVQNAETTGRPSVKKLTANKVRKIIDHFNKYFSSTTGGAKGNINPSRGDLSRTYRLYKKEVSIPVSFYFYVKVFNLNFRQITGGGNSGEKQQFSNTENSNSYQECSVNEISDEWQSSIQTNLSPLIPNETKIIKHFNEIYNNPDRYRRIGFSVKNPDPPLQKMYEIYKKSVTVPITFARYVNIFNTHFKSSLSKQSTISTVKDPATNNSETLQGSEAEVTKQPIDVKVGLQQSFNVLPVEKIKEVTEHFSEFYNNPSKYKTIGFSVKYANPPLWRMYKVYKKKVTLPVNFHHYTEIFYTTYKDTLSKRSKTDKAQYSSPNINFAYLKQRRKHLGKVVCTGSHVKPNSERKNRKTVKTLRQEPLDNISLARTVQVINHFKEFYHFISCRNESNVPLEFVNKNLPLKEMYNLYRAEAVKPVSYQHFFHIFCVNFKYKKDQLGTLKKESSEVGKSNDDDPNENAKVCNSSITNGPTSRVQKQTSSVRLPREKVRAVIDYLEKSFNQASCHSLPWLYTRYKQNSASPVSYYHFSKIFKNKFTCDKKNWLQSDVDKNAECQNAVVYLSKIDIPLQFQKRPLTSKTDKEYTSNSDPEQDFIKAETVAENVCSSNNDSFNVSTALECTSNSDPERDFINAGTVAERVCSSNDDSRHHSFNISTALESAVPCISSTNCSDVTETLYEDISKLLTEMIESIEHDKYIVSETNDVAVKKEITDEGESLLNKDLGTTQQ